jgi:serine/threonine protein kinase
MSSTPLLSLKQRILLSTPFFVLFHESTFTSSTQGNCGTVQWMAPEVLANEKYAEPADVYSCGIILWELLSRECPYEGMEPIQCAVAVLNRGIRPDIPNWCPPPFAALISSCVAQEAEVRPTFMQILSALDAMPN